MGLLSQLLDVELWLDDLLICCYHVSGVLLLHIKRLIKVFWCDEGIADFQLGCTFITWYSKLFLVTVKVSFPTCHMG